MAESRELFDCSICLQLLEDPVTTTCGHSYCMKCVNAFWDSNNDRGRRFSCPQCRQTFFPRPVLKRNTLLAALIEEHKGENRQNAAAGDTYAEPGDVQCDVCTGRKRKASMFCLVCLASYCETHLKPHYEVAPLKKHKLMEASAQIRDSICGRHDKLLEIYCRTDQQFICLLCLMGEHKGHDTVAVAEEKCHMQRQLERTKEEITDRVEKSERTMEKLREAADVIRGAAWEACDDFERLCAEHIRLYVRSVERKCSEMREKVGEAEKAGVDWTDCRLGRLQREVLELRRREDQIDRLTLTEDPIQFLQGFQALDHLPALTASHERIDTLTEFVTAQKKKLKNMCDKKKSELFSRSENNLLSDIPRLREEILSRTYLLTNIRVSMMLFHFARLSSHTSTLASPAKCVLRLSLQTSEWRWIPTQSLRVFACLIETDRYRGVPWSRLTLITLTDSPSVTRLCAKWAWRGAATGRWSGMWALLI
uniref:E3 ubiquitin/ISG15 ligase TRIM25-like n=1 Tax=Sparus aurata TaxID=8175 RepID=A0A671U088_SPAAU